MGWVIVCFPRKVSKERQRNNDIEFNEGWWIIQFIRSLLKRIIIIMGEGPVIYSKLPSFQLRSRFGTKSQSQSQSSSSLSASLCYSSSLKTPLRP